MLQFMTIKEIINVMQHGHIVMIVTGNHLQQKKVISYIRANYPFTFRQVNNATGDIFFDNGSIVKVVAYNQDILRGVRVNRVVFYGEGGVKVTDEMEIDAYHATHQDNYYTHKVVVTNG